MSKLFNKLFERLGLNQAIKHALELGLAPGRGGHFGAVLSHCCSLSIALFIMHLLT